MLKSSRCFLLGGITISATVGAALKKIAVMILTNKKVMKKVLVVVVSLIMALLLTLGKTVADFGLDGFIAFFSPAVSSFVTQV